MTERTDTHPASGRAWAAAGLLAALSGLAAGHLLAALTAPRAAPLSAVSDLIISLAPAGFTDWAIDTFGTADKPLLQAGIIAALAAAGAGAGLTWRHRPRTAAALIAALAAVGALAAATRPGLGPAAAVPAILAAAWTAAALHWWAGRGRAATVTGRRTFLALAAGAGLAALAGALIARRIGPGSVESDRAALDLPEPDIDAADPGPAADLDVRGLEPWHTPNDDFYRIDTAITAPTVEADTWRLRVHGRVGREHTYTLDDLLGRELIERDLTLCCVSNPIGGDLVGNARWLGVSLPDLLAESDPDPEADQLVSRSADGWTAGSPTAAVFDGRDALIAIGMNGQPLPHEHGWPARLVIPGLYGYVSATKWLTELELTTFDAYDAYWIERGWSRPAPIKTASRIDTPRRGARPGTVTVAGVAWAQQRGISAVHLRIDDGEWTECELSQVATDDTWRQWKTDWQAAPGPHTLTVRATDGDGNPQTEAVTGVKPDGATGLHQVTVDVQ
ncbi:molybdopterin-dependent oxidoreductase [Glycomyces xiaoerkulensis]|uniref:molybdopterin-dependent oxidoreductase n=1 Tax=Glycomyces xiaoerkulensis TaxID=2038139 RepID=UPI000C26A715|nr:molybdopterin-dependent oxidoreductase [Glycomyces xiaoerkulensis]